MLVYDLIPDKEPMIRAGIILPQDKRKSLVMELPSGFLYTLENVRGITFIPDRKKLTFTLSGNKDILVSRMEAHAGDVWFIRPVDKAMPMEKPAMPDRLGRLDKLGKPGESEETDDPVKGKCILVRDVIAGRNFHWRKTIDVFLPGLLEIRSHEGSLILINELPLETYLMCVATSEMGSDCPQALIESQTIAARSWILACAEKKHGSLGMDVCNDDCCQRYHGTGSVTGHSMRSTRKTRGQVLLCSGKICDARYSKCCGGVTESFTTVWGGKTKPYLKVLPDASAPYKSHKFPMRSDSSARKWIEDRPLAFCNLSRIQESLGSYLGGVDEPGQYFRWSVRYPQDEIRDLLNDQLNLRASSIQSVKTLKRGGSGRITELAIDYRDNGGQLRTCKLNDQYQIRRSLHRQFLYSSSFVVDVQGKRDDIPDAFIFKGAGWGHGVGYCQIGALGMALEGYTTGQILEHYFPGSQLKKIY